jgi:hypothetical protein
MIKRREYHHSLWYPPRRVVTTKELTSTNHQILPSLYFYRDFIFIDIIYQYLECKVVVKDIFSIKDTTFERFGTCGSIVRNFKNTLELPTIDDTTTPDEIYLLRHVRLETELFYDREYRKNLFSESPFKDKCTTTSSLVTDILPACFSLEITDS